MEITNMLLIGGVLGGLLVLALGVLFLVSRKTQKVMQSLLTIMTQPERAKVTDASRVLAIILADEISKIEQSFQTMRDTLNAQIATLNGHIESLSKEYENVDYINTAVLLADASGALSPEYDIGDGIHLTNEAYRIILRFLCQSINKAE